MNENLMRPEINKTTDTTNNIGSTTNAKNTTNMINAASTIASIKEIYRDICL
jgi:hypothetical protein